MPTTDSRLVQPTKHSLLTLRCGPPNQIRWLCHCLVASIASAQSSLHGTTFKEHFPSAQRLQAIVRLGFHVYHRGGISPTY
jgi:hypothetical protein